MAAGESLRNDSIMSKLKEPGSADMKRDKVASEYVHKRELEAARNQATAFAEFTHVAGMMRKQHNSLSKSHQDRTRSGNPSGSPSGFPNRNRQGDRSQSTTNARPSGNPQQQIQANGGIINE